MTIDRRDIAEAVYKHIKRAVKVFRRKVQIEELYEHKQIHCVIYMPNGTQRRPRLCIDCLIGEDGCSVVDTMYEYDDPEAFDKIVSHICDLLENPDRLWRELRASPSYKP